MTEESDSCMGCGCLAMFSLVGLPLIVGSLASGANQGPIIVMSAISLFVSLSLWVITMFNLSQEERVQFQTAAVGLIVGLGIPLTTIVTGNTVGLPSWAITASYIVFVVAVVAVGYNCLPDKGASRDRPPTGRRYLVTFGLLFPALTAIAWWMDWADATWQDLAVVYGEASLLLVALSIWIVGVWDMRYSEIIRFHSALALVAVGMGAPVALLVIAEDIGLPASARPWCYVIPVAIALLLVYIHRASGAHDRSRSHRREGVAPSFWGGLTGVLLTPVIVGLIWVTRDSVVVWWDWLISHLPG